MMDKISSNLNSTAVEPQSDSDRKARSKDEGKDGRAFAGQLLAASSGAARPHAASLRGASGVASHAGNGESRTVAAGQSGSRAGGVTPTALENKVRQLKEREAGLGNSSTYFRGQGNEASRDVSQVRRVASQTSPLTSVAAASSNTASAFAGLKPWSRDWVFQPGDEDNPELRGLFSPSEPKGPAQNGIGQDQKVSPRKNAEGLVQGGNAGTAHSVAQNGALVAAGVDPKQLEGILRELNGMGEVAQAQGLPIQARGLVQVRPALAGQPGVRRAQLDGGLSGSEYLSTLGAVRGQAGNAQAVIDPSEAGLVWMEPDQTAGANRSQPELRVLTGRKEDRTFGDTLTGRDDLASLAGLHAGAHLAHQQGIPMPRAEVTGHVASGAMAQPRLSTDSLMGMSAGIRNLSMQGGGEMRVRLKPDGMGELNLRVVASGNNVGLQIQASDEKAKKVIEDSLSHLKESLSAQSLRLAQVDVSLAPQLSGGSSDFRQNDQGTPWQGASQSHNRGDFTQGNLGQNAHRDGQQGTGWLASDRAMSAPSVARAASRWAGSTGVSSASSRQAAQNNGRLDVTA